MTRKRFLAVALGVALFSGSAWGQTFSVAIDTDLDAATGCAVAATDAGGSTSLSGFELLFSIIVAPAVPGPQVSQTQLQTCNTGTGMFGAPTVVEGTPYPVALNMGIGGADSLEAELPANFLTGAGDVLRLAVVSSAPSGSNDALVAGTTGNPIVFPPGVVGIPTLGEWALILLSLLLAGAGVLFLQRRGPGGSAPVLTALIAALALSTLVYGVTLVADGDVMDWGGVGPLALDPQGDSTQGDPSGDLVALFVSEGSLFFRVDVQDLEQDPPVAVDDTASTAEDTAVIIDVLANDSDPDVVDTLDVISVTSPTDGTAVINPDDTVTYTPTADFNGPDGFSYTIRDNTGLTATADVDVTVNAVNDPPMAADDTATTAEDTPVDIDVLANDTDVEGPLTVVGFTQGANGAVSDQGGGVLRYSPDPDFNGMDSFTYTAQNGGSDTDMATVTVTVDPVNDAPFFTSVPPTTATQDVPYSYSITTADVDAGDVRTLGALTVPGWLMLVDNGDGTGTLNGTPTNADIGANSVELSVTDLLGASSTQPFTVTVDDVNDAPTANAQMATTNEDTALVITLTGSDPDGDSLNFSIDTGPADGSLGSITPTGATTAEVTYTPDGNFNGADSFTFTVDDGALTSPAATVDITVNPINDDPVANPQSQTTPEDTAIMLTLTGSDVDGDTLTFSIDTGPSDGTLGAVTQVPPTSATVTYTPDMDFNGTDSFTFTVDDGNGGTSTATVDLTIGSENDAPVANASMVSTTEDVALPIMLTGSDVDGDALTFTIVPMSGPSNGSLGAIMPVNDTTAMVTYTPNPDFNGTDQFTFMVDDGNGATDTATVDITVDPVQDSPTANPQMQTINEDTAVMLLLTGSDVDGDALTFTIVPMSGPADGILSAITPVDATSAMVTYTPDPNFNGMDAFDFQVDDGNGNTDTATVDITVEPVNDPPVARDDDVTTDEATLLAGDVLADNGNGADSDVEGDPLTVTAVSDGGTIGVQFALPSGALLTLNANGTFDYDPNGAFEALAVGETGADSFGYTISDGNGGSDMATVNVSIDGLNDPPTAQDDDVATDSNAVLNGDVLVDNGNGADSDPDADTLTVSEVNGNAGDVGMQIALGSGALVTLNANGTFTYDPNGAFDSLPTGMTDTDSFTYTLSDGNGGTDGATVTVTITGTNSAPVAQDDDFTTDEDTALMGDVTADNGNGPDNDPDGDPLTVTELNGSAMDIGTPTMLPSGALVTLNAAGTFTYNPNGMFDSLGPGQMAMDSFGYTVSDGNGGTDTATVTIDITGLNDAPMDGDEGMAGAGAFTAVGNTELVVENGAQSAANNGADFVAVAGNLLTNASDVDLPAMTLNAVAATGNSTLGGDFEVFADGSFTYVPPVGVTGMTDSFGYTVTDGTDTDTSTVFIDIGGIVWFIDNQNDAQNPVGGDGRSTDPFDSLGAFNAVNNGMAGNPAAGHRIFVYQGSSSYAGGISLLNDQQLTGHGSSLTEGGLTISSASHPQLNDSAGDIVQIEDDNIVEGLFLEPVGANSAIVGNGDGGTTTVRNVAINLGGPSTGIDLLNQTGTFNFTLQANIQSVAAGAGTAILVDGGSASVNFDFMAFNKIGGTGIDIRNRSGMTFFGASGGIDITAGDGQPAVTLTDNTGDINFSSGFNTLVNTMGVGLFANNNSGVVRIGNTTTAINATGGAALDVSNTNLTGPGGGPGWTFDSLRSANSPAAGIRLVGIDDPITVTNAGMGISGAAGAAVMIDGGSGGFTYPGAVNNSAARSADIRNRTGGAVTLSGNITDTGTGIFLDNNDTGAMGSISFTGQVDITNPPGDAVTMQNSNSGTVSFSDLDISTTNIRGLFATANTGGRLESTTGTISTGSAVAVDIDNTDLGLTFASINVNAASTGIDLNTTTGTFEVTGDGPSDPANTTRGRTTAAMGGGTLTLGSGGSLTNTTGDAVTLNNAAGVTLRNMVLTNDGTGSRDGVSATGGSALALDNTRITGFSDNGVRGSSGLTGFTMQHTEVENNAKSGDSIANDEANLRFDNLFGMATISNSLIRDVNQDNIRVSSCEFANCGGSSLAFNVNNTSIRDTLSGPGGNDGILIRSFNDGNVALTVTGSEFLGNRANSIQHNTNGSSQGSTTITGSTFGRNTIAINIAHQGLGQTHSFSILNNMINQVNGTPSNFGNAVNVFLAGLSNGSSVLSGTISGNAIGNAAVADSGSENGRGIDLFASGAGTLTANVTTNTVRAVRIDSAFRAISSSHTGNINVTLRGNDFSVLPTSNFALAGVDLAAGALPGDTGVMCADLLGSGGVPPGGTENIAAVGDPFFAGAYITTAAGNPTIELVGYAGADNNQGQIEAFLDSIAATVSPAATGSFTTFLGAGTVTGRMSACPLP